MCFVSAPPFLPLFPILFKIYRTSPGGEVLFQSFPLFDRFWRRRIKECDFYLRGSSFTLSLCLVTMCTLKNNISR